MSAFRDQKKVLGPLGLELQMVMSILMDFFFEPRSSGMAARAHSSKAISLAIIILFLSLFLQSL